MEGMTTQTTQWSKEKGQNNDLQIITQKTKPRVNSGAPEW
jgi:hypothetical protein